MPSYSFGVRTPGHIYCPVCEHRGAPGPVTASGPRESLCCHHCGCTSRQRATWLALHRDLSLTQLGSRQRVYQVGSDRLTERLELDVHNFELEVSECDGPNPQNLEHLAIYERSFDFILCTDVLEHVRLYKRALDELARVLAFDGMLILTVPMNGDAQQHHHFCDVREKPEWDNWAADTPVHEDPRNSAGCRVYRTYGLELLSNQLLERGLVPEILEGDIPVMGIVNSTVIVGRKLE